MNAALRFCELRDQRQSIRRPIDELYAADLRFGLPSGTFVEMFREQPSGWWTSARRDLEIAKQQLDAAQRANNPSVLGELANIDVGPAIFRVCCATVAGALIGAPLGALAIHESVPLKMTEAAFVTGAAAALAEVYQPLSGLLSRDKPPAEPITVLDIVLSTSRTRRDPAACSTTLNPHFSRSCRTKIRHWNFGGQAPYSARIVQYYGARAESLVALSHARHRPNSVRRPVRAMGATKHIAEFPDRRSIIATGTRRHTWFKDSQRQGSVITRSAKARCRPLLRAASARHPHEGQSFQRTGTTWHT